MDAPRRMEIILNFPDEPGKHISIRTVDPNLRLIVYGFHKLLKHPECVGRTCSFTLREHQGATDEVHDLTPDLSNLESGDSEEEDDYED